MMENMNNKMQTSSNLSTIDEHSKRHGKISQINEHGNMCILQHDDGDLLDVPDLKAH